MGITLTQVPRNNNTGENTDPIAYTTEYDGQSFNWAPGQTRSFTDEAVGSETAKNVSGPGAGPASAAVAEDNSVSTKAYPNDDSRS